ncbi:hypothetical protein BJ138DRAFT_1161554 [Hygrophoropsis aurantiaca]|uniref:Uncharacterized protein n=1 Tax=Hygrophoropsis aurantiaca TaxID=72124 RepID=A0ACB8A2F3_9AGAM|nr:hypothetical protein BJ138DRAFT_1161554 [Hygrophoropsis aurantiaca]
MSTLTVDLNTFAYKLVSSSDTPPDPLPERLPVSQLDLQSGYIHLSTSRQVANTLNYFFKEDTHVYILRIRYETVKDKIRWEDPVTKDCGPRGGEGLFPHIYNDDGQGLKRDEVDSVRKMERGDGEDMWDAALKLAEKEGWLVY